MAQPLHGLLQLVIRGGGEGEAEEGARQGGVRPQGVGNAPRHQSHRRLRQQIQDLVRISDSCPQRQPQEHAGLGCTPAGNPDEVLLGGRQHYARPPPIFKLHVAHVSLQPLLTPRLQHLCHHNLGGSTGAQGGAVHAAGQLADDGGRPGGPPQAQPRRQGLGEAVQPHHPPIRVQAQVAALQLPQPTWLPRGQWELEGVVGIIFQQHQVELLAQRIDLCLPRQWHCGPRWILAGGDGI
mmetsp:Transcript_12909/g.39021  ORF Transcript_12909/g.39021 Transcript_12909/m.39021 type:complete len:238 (+) Transcript_12909:4831-5544(+)